MLVGFLFAATPAWGQVVFGHGQLTLNSSNGGETLTSTTTLVSAVSVKASCANTVDIMIGGSTLNYSSSKGRSLAPCEPIDFQFAPKDNLKSIYVDAGTTASQIVEYDFVVGP